MDKEPVPFLVIERGCSSCLLLIPPTLWKSIKSQLCILDFEHILYQRIHNDPRSPRHCATYYTTFFLSLPLFLSSFHTREKKNVNTYNSLRREKGLHFRESMDNILVSLPLFLVCQKMLIKMWEIVTKFKIFLFFLLSVNVIICK